VETSFISDSVAEKSLVKTNIVGMLMIVNYD